MVHAFINSIFKVKDLHVRQTCHVVCTWCVHTCIQYSMPTRIYRLCVCVCVCVCSTVYCVLCARNNDVCCTDVYYCTVHVYTRRTYRSRYTTEYHLNQLLIPPTFMFMVLTQPPMVLPVRLYLSPVPVAAAFFFSCSFCSRLHSLLWPALQWFIWQSRLQ
jgi:hypothetical protein